MKITMLGTGNAMVTKCYNTTFVLTNGEKQLLVDGGGGNKIFNQLEDAGIDWKNIKEIFVTHKHVDHVIGIIWMIRKICRSMKKGEYVGNVNIYAHGELCDIINSIAHMLLNKKETDFIGERVHIIPVEDGEEREIIGNKTVFFDIHSTKAKQFGFSMIYDNNKNLLAVVMNHTTKKKKNMLKIAIGYFTKHFVCIQKRINLNLMKNIIQQLKMLVNLQQN